MRYSVIAGIVSLTAVAGLSQAQQLTPRDAFWSASDLVSVSSNAGAKASETRVHTKRPAPEHTSAPAVPRATEPSAHVSPVLVAENGYGAPPHMVRVSEEQIGMRYSLLLENSEGAYREVSPKAVFHSGDHLHLSIMANQPGYLYVIDQGSTGNWQSIFPAPGSSPDANKVEPGYLNEIPRGHASFRFDQNPGKEKLFIILSRQPIADLDSTIGRLKGSATPAQAPAAEQPQQPSAGPTGQVFEASNHIPDELVQRLASRDLTLVEEQQVGDKPAGEQAAGEHDAGEKAVYVVSKGVPHGSAGPEVVAAVTLRHE